MPPKTTSFAADIAPMLYNFAPQMAWRMDLTKYEDVKTNASLIYGQIRLDQGPPGMPPPPYPPLSADDVATFLQWMTTDNFPK